MMRLHHVRGVFAFSVLIIVLGNITSVSAEEAFRAKEGFYVGINFSYHTVDGDFDGEEVLVGSEDIIIIPQIKDSLGLGISMGIRNSWGAVELSYNRSEHDVIFLGTRGEAEYYVLDFNIKPHFNTDRPLQPYLLYGPSVERLIVKDGSASMTSIGDARFYGFGFNLGGGISYFFNPHITMNAGTTYRFIEYVSAKGAAGNRESLLNSLSGNGLNLILGLAFIF